MCLVIEIMTIHSYTKKSRHNLATISCILHVFKALFNFLSEFVSLIFYTSILQELINKILITFQILSDKLLLKTRDV